MAAQCALAEEHEGEVTKTFQQYTSVVNIVQASKVAPELEPEAELAAGENPEPNHVNKPDDIEQGKKGDELGGETKEGNGKEEVENVEEITEKINGVGIGKEDDAAEEKPESDVKNGEEEVKTEANADGNEEGGN